MTARSVHPPSLNVSITTGHYATPPKECRGCTYSTDLKQEVSVRFPTSLQPPPTIFSQSHETDNNEHSTLNYRTIMQLLSMYLALFLATILATTDAVARGSKNTVAARDEDLVDPRPSFRELGFFIEDSFAELTCKMLETFDNMGRDENKFGVGLNWAPLCDDFDPLDDYLCPGEEEVADICLAKLPLENPAVRKNWCIPVFGAIEDLDRRTDCIKFCTNYVSAARGDCCGSGIAVACGIEV
jgi:hypothetical protein